MKSITKLNIADVIYPIIVNFQKNMASWEVEKDKYLRINAETKRKNCVKVGDILTWKTEKISIFEGNITNLAVDASANAANSSLLGGGGVDGAIHGAAGPFLNEECRTLGGCQVGEAKITGGYQLPCRYAIHTVGPKEEYPEKLKKCYRNSLEVLVSKKLRTIAFPCISTGIYGFPILSAAHAATYQVRKYLKDNTDQIDRVIFCLFMDEGKTFNAHRDKHKGYLEEIDEKDGDATANASEQSLVKLLEKILEKSQKETEQNSGKLANEFAIDEFDGRNVNAEQWWGNFEKECERFNITRSEKKIEILKSFMEFFQQKIYILTFRYLLYLFP
ncbi:hypothetical protein WA026_006015 [Henosepilachna vigintioctopunctata]|uniref:Macro domain-containing protein n=1 Tax=Henosepilachna vigintioctopunctata TaxID=420089 RepID=A0AAW1TNK9_9CUCU